MMRTATASLVAVLLAAAAAAQDESYGKDYAFADRAPRTRLERLIDDNLPSLVKVHGASGLATIKAYATGVIVSKEGHVLTLDLIMIQRGQTRVVLHDGSVYRAKVFPSDDKLGVRMLKIDAPGVEFRPLKPSPDRGYRSGTFVVSMGNAYRLAEFSEKLSATFGVLTARTRTGLRYKLSDVDYDGELLVTDAPNNPGSYGGALLTLNGDWIGLNTRILESTETNTEISAAIPTWDLVRYIQRFTEHDHAAPPAPRAAVEVKPVYHGIVLFDHGLRRSPPAYVERVERGSPGRAAGLRPDDLIVRLDDYAIRSCVEFRHVMSKLAPGHVVQLTIKRGNKVLRKSMTLEEAK